MNEGRPMNENKDAAQKSLLHKGTNFLISIYHQENHSYQGTIQWIDTGKKVSFRSELELLNLIHEATNYNSNDGQNMRTWKDSKESNVG